MKSSSLCMFIPWWATYFPNISGYNYMNGQLGPLWKLLRKHIDYHKSQMKNNPAEVYPDIIGSYLKEMSQATDPKSSFYGKAGGKKHSCLAFLKVQLRNFIPNKKISIFRE
jgi:hypothetical protein